MTVGQGLATTQGKDTVVAEGFLKAEQICSGRAAAACAEAGLS